MAFKSEAIDQSFSGAEMRAIPKATAIAARINLSKSMFPPSLRKIISGRADGSKNEG
jgi:hypothetical protein